MAIERPAALFDRVTEWDDLVRFATEPTTSFRIGVVSGRRRQGKSFILDEVARQVGGFYHQALEEERAPALERLGAAMAADRGLAGGSLSFPDWAALLRTLAEPVTPELPTPSPRLVVIDEYPYLLAKSPDIASAIQLAHDASRLGRQPPLRLILCGSAMSVMAGLLSGQRALRGRAVLDLVVEPFDYREAAAFWGVQGDPRLAFLLFCVVGGTPGYRDLLEMGPPTSVADFPAWLARGVLNPSHAMFRETDYLLAEEPSLTDRAIYQSALAAIAAGRTTSGAVAGALGRPETSVTHVIDGLERAHFIERADDVLRLRRPTLRITDAMLRFQHAIVRPDFHRFESRQTLAAWSNATARFESGIAGPAFEAIARAWTSRYASAETLGGIAVRVGSTVVNDSAGRSRVEIDVVALEAPSDHEAGVNPTLLLVGEAKSGPDPRGMADLHRLERARELLEGRARVERTRLAIFAAGGFTADLQDEATRRSDVILVDLERLYAGA
ncbi:MAG: ATP-binding protein [Chloroflexota bacterium]